MPPSIAGSAIHSARGWPTRGATARRLQGAEKGQWAESQIFSDLRARGRGQSDAQRRKRAALQLTNPDHRRGGGMAGRLGGSTRLGADVPLPKTVVELQALSLTQLSNKHARAKERRRKEEKTYVVGEGALSA